MTRYLVLDAGPAQAFIQHKSTDFERVFEYIRRGIVVGMSYPTLGEVQGGFEASASRERNLRSLRASFQWLKRWPFDLDAVQIYAVLAGKLRLAGRSIGQIDLQVAAVALSKGNAIVATYDNDLFAVPGLTVENWLDKP